MFAWPSSRHGRKKKEDERQKGEEEGKRGGKKEGAWAMDHFSPSPFFELDQFDERTRFQGGEENKKKKEKEKGGGGNKLGLHTPSVPERSIYHLKSCARGGRERARKKKRRRGKGIRGKGGGGGRKTSPGRLILSC